MTMNIPVNLMTTTTPPTQAQTVAVMAAEAVSATAVQPAMGSSGARGATADGGAGSGSSKGQAEQRLKALMQSTIAEQRTRTPDRAEPKSVVTAQAGPENPPQTQTSEVAKAPQVRQQALSEIDRYAPPNPLPTAPILQLAASYAALMDQAA